MRMYYGSGTTDVTYARWASRQPAAAAIYAAASGGRT